MLAHAARGPGASVFLRNAYDEHDLGSRLIGLMPNVIDAMPITRG